LPDTLTPAPTAVPPLAHTVGADDCGPNTSKVIVPDGDAPADNGAWIADAGIGCPASSDGGALIVIVGLTGPTTVSVPKAPQVDVAWLLLESPL
jgi:hypothetical protein